MLAALDSVYGQRKDNPHILRPKKRPCTHFCLPILSQSLGSEGSAVVRPRYGSDYGEGSGGHCLIVLNPYAGLRETTTTDSRKVDGR